MKIGHRSDGERTLPARLLRDPVAAFMFARMANTVRETRALQCSASRMRRTQKRVGNQRVSNSRQRRRQHLLDVKVRSRSATEQRNRRILVFISKVVLATALMIGIYFGAREACPPVVFRKSRLSRSTQSRCRPMAHCSATRFWERGRSPRGRKHFRCQSRTGARSIAAASASR